MNKVREHAVNCLLGLALGGGLIGMCWLAGTLSDWLIG